MTNRLISLLVPVLLLISCKSIHIDYCVIDKSPTSTDVFYIKNIEIHSNYSMSHITDSLNRLLMFTMQKKHYAVKSYMVDPGIADNYRYHIDLKAYIHQTGTTLDKEFSIIVFYIIYDTKLKKEIIHVRASCNGCDLLNVDDQINLFETLVTQFDSIIKK